MYYVCKQYVSIYVIGQSVNIISHHLSVDELDHARSRTTLWLIKGGFCISIS